MVPNQMTDRDDALKRAWDALPSDWTILDRRVVEYEGKLEYAEVQGAYMGSPDDWLLKGKVGLFSAQYWFISGDLGIREGVWEMDPEWGFWVKREDLDTIRKMFDDD